MQYRIKLTNRGVELSQYEGDVPGPLEPSPDADQDHPRRYYIYAHLDSAGEIFYIGKGTGRRAWSPDRHPLWSRYVEKHLGGEYQVRILQDNLSPGEAEELEAAWIDQYSDRVVNWINMGREIDLETLDRRNALRTGNLAVIREAEAIEKHDRDKAAVMYIQAIETIRSYAFLTYEKGLVGKLLGEEAADLGVHGEIHALDRLTMCLIKLGRPEEAAQRAEDYFSQYARDRQLIVAARITHRVRKAIERAHRKGKSMPQDGPTVEANRY
jgi:hypothetical protein